MNILIISDKACFNFSLCRFGHRKYQNGIVIKNNA